MYYATCSAFTIIVAESILMSTVSSIIDASTVPYRLHTHSINITLSYKIVASFFIIHYHALEACLTLCAHLKLYLLFLYCAHTQL